MSCSARIISEVLSEIPTMNKCDFLKPMIYPRINHSLFYLQFSMLSLLFDSFVSFPSIACFFYLVVEALKIFKVHALSKGLITIVI